MLLEVKWDIVMIKGSVHQEDISLECLYQITYKLYETEIDRNKKICINS